ncbi:MAG: hypothetical protein KBA28_02905 [Syntrophaceae bacterium]|jgi:hypothetical protein|nr:hypothetical protein [Syntrophaceae bacterium]HOC58523.1 transporter [Smithellaceae bacterium]HQM44837.1 transporter [Smithellaceae bacterium]
METKKVLLVMTILMLFAGTTTPWISSAQDDRPTLRKITQEKSQDLKEGQFLLEMTPCYYKYKTDSEDWMNMGLFFKANVAPSLEIGIGSDFLSYQNPDFGLSDIYAGAKWKFYAKNDWTLAISGYILFPTGDKAFREPGIEPTLTLLVSRTLGAWEISLSVGSTYAADEQGDPNYLDLEMGIEVDYTPDAKNSFSIFSTGYGPDQRIDGGHRSLVGTSYTRTLTDHQSLGIMFMKGLSSRGMDWSSLLTYSLTF